MATVPVPDGFGGRLILYGNRLQRNDALYSDMPEDDPFPDFVTFSGNINVDYLEVFADHIVVEENVEITTGDDGIFFRQRNMGVATLENLSPALGTKREVSLEIGKNAKLSGGNIFLVLQAEDNSLSDVIGAGQEVSNFVIDPLIGLLENALALPVKVLVKETKATITIHENVEITSQNTVGIYATAATDASGAASSSMFIIAYGQARAHANIDIRPGVRITAEEGAVVITSTANGTANVSAATERSLQSTPNPGGRGGFKVGEDQYDKGTNQFAVAIGVAYVDVFSHLTIAEGVEITAGKTANIAAGGEIDSSGTGEAGIFGNGAAGLGFGIEISKADIATVVNGTVTAKMVPGSAVKLEIDPTVTISTHTNNQTNVVLNPGDSVLLLEELGGYSVGQILVYTGVISLENANLKTQAYDDNSLWEEGTPNEGYVDYESNRIFLGDIGLVTEDTVTYTNRYGTSIGGLVDTREYYLVADEDNPGYFWLAETEVQAVRASNGHTAAALGNVVRLQEKSGILETANNVRMFSLDHVDFAGNTISLKRNYVKGDKETVNFNSFELGQAVVYERVSGPEIPGLKHGETYYIATSTSQNDLQGDSRLVDQQVIRLSRTENEARAGVTIDIGPLGTQVSLEPEYKLIAKHVLDSGLATGIGIVATLSASNNASATAGLTSEDTNPGRISKFKSAVDDVSINGLFNKLTSPYSENVTKADAATKDAKTPAGDTSRGQHWGKKFPVGSRRIILRLCGPQSRFKGRLER